MYLLSFLNKLYASSLKKGINFIIDLLYPLVYRCGFIFIYLFDYYFINWILVQAQTRVIIAY